MALCNDEFISPNLKLNGCVLRVNHRLTSLYTKEKVLVRRNEKLCS